MKIWWVLTSDEGNCCMKTKKVFLGKNLRRKYENCWAKFNDGRWRYHYEYEGIEQNVLLLNVLSLLAYFLLQHGLVGKREHHNKSSKTRLSSFFFAHSSTHDVAKESLWKVDFTWSSVDEDDSKPLTTRWREAFTLLQNRLQSGCMVYE